jgi:hypothetical protein
MLFFLVIRRALEVIANLVQRRSMAELSSFR